MRAAYLLKLPMVDVSKKLMPSSCARSMIACDSAGGVRGPNGFQLFMPAPGTAASAAAEHLVLLGVGQELPYLLRTAADHGDLGGPR